MKNREGVAAALVIILTGISLYVVVQGSLVSFGNFPQRPAEENLQNYEQALQYYENGELTQEEISNIMEDRPENFGRQSISKDILQRFSEQTGAANAVTAILWDYRGYDTLGEATVIFVAVASVAGLFRAKKEEDEENE